MDFKIRTLPVSDGNPLRRLLLRSKGIGEVDVIGLHGKPSLV